MIKTTDLVPIRLKKDTSNRMSFRLIRFHSGILFLILRDVRCYYMAK